MPVVCFVSRSQIRACLILRGSNLHGRYTKTIAVAIEQYASILAFRALAGLDPVAPAGALVKAVNEAQRPSFGIGAVMAAHDLLNGFGGFISVVERNSADIVMKDMGFDDAMENVSADKSKFAIDGRSGSTNIIPGISGIVRQSGVCMLEEGDGNC